MPDDLPNATTLYELCFYLATILLGSAAGFCITVLDRRYRNVLDLLVSSVTSGLAACCAVLLLVSEPGAFVDRWPRYLGISIGVGFLGRSSVPLLNWLTQKAMGVTNGRGPLAGEDEDRADRNSDGAGGGSADTDAQRSAGS